MSTEIKQLNVSDVLRDPKNGLGDAWEDGVVYRLVPEGDLAKVKYRNHVVVAECAANIAGESKLYLMKENKDGNASV